MLTSPAGRRAVARLRQADTQPRPSNGTRRGETACARVRMSVVIGVGMGLDVSGVIMQLALQHVRVTDMNS